MPSSISKFATIAQTRGAELFISGVTEDPSADDVVFITIEQSDGGFTQGRFVMDLPGGKDSWTATLPIGTITPGPALASGLLATLSHDPSFRGHQTFCWADNVEIEALPSSKDDPPS